ncbi:hypothetical protein, partial [Acidithiobacillus thiooxidans]|uniref:hypothetical protein n=1 Tax=Acidithiobacillus thiooxidans TaxID=930 RepID=UPI001C068E12
PILGDYSAPLKISGYNAAQLPVTVEVLLHGDHLWLGIDLLPRNHQEMIFYHLLLKLSFKRIIDPGFFTPTRFSL